jgi:hypothetical protein
MAVEDERDAIRRGDAFQVGRCDLPALTLDVLEGIAVRFGAARGLCRIELEFDDGMFKVGWKHERITTGRLRDLDEAAGVYDSPATTR